MSRLFLSGQMTCAMLLGAGLLLRAQAALHPPETGSQTQTAIESPRTRPSDMMAERARPAPRIVRDEAPSAPRVVQKNSHSRKGFAHRTMRSRVRKTGVALAQHNIRRG